MDNGFYKFENELLFGQLITGPDILLLIEDHELYSYPTEGWYYFDSEEEALDFFQINN